MTGNKLPNWLLYSAVFIAGMSTLGIELSASRLLGHVFGTSNLVWANIIGLILIYLTAGYFLGGRWADRSPYPRTFFQIIAAAALTSGTVPLIAQPVLRNAARAVAQLDAAVMLGSFLSVLLLFVVPVTLLGCVSPFAIRLAIENKEHAGRVSGRIYAISTLGSILGTFLPVLLLIPEIGTTATFLFFSLMLLVVSLLGLLRINRRLATVYGVLSAGLALAAALALGNPLKATPGQIYEDESQYNYIEVVEIAGTRYLLLNEGQAVHSVYNPDSLATFGTWDYFLAAPLFYPPETEPSDIDRVGLVGLAAGTIAKQYSAVYGPVPIDGWEIDPSIIEVGREFFAMTEPNLNAIAADGRWGLEQSQHRYDVIGIDAYRPPYIPWHLTTLEFFQLVADRLTTDGVLVINVGRTPEDRRLIEAIVGTLDPVFASIHVVDVPSTFNTIVYATIQPTSPAALDENLRSLSQRQSHPFLLDVLSRTSANLVQTPESNIVFTDDKAPVEQLVNSIVIRYLLGQGLSELAVFPGS